MATGTDYSCVHLYSPILKYILTPAELTSSKLKTIIKDDALNAVKESKVQEKEKVLKILELIGESEDDSKLELLIGVLDILGFIFVQKALSKQHSEETQEKLKKIVVILAEEGLDTKTLSKLALDHGLIQAVNHENVLTECDNYDDKTGLIVLIDSVVTPPPDEWYEEFMKCLCEADYGEIVTRIRDYDNMEEECSASNSKQQSFESLSEDEYWRKLVMELFHKFIIAHVRPSDLIVNLYNVLGKADIIKIRKMQNQQSEEEAMREMLQKIDESTSPGKWASFRDALHNANYVKIIEAVDGRLINFEDEEKWQNMIKIFNEVLMSKINPFEILPDLVNEKLISEEELQEISQECRYRGERSANFLLLMCIPRRHPEWYPVFMEVLFLKGWDEFVNEIDEDEWKRLNQKHEGKMTKNSKFYADQSVNIAVNTSKTMVVKLNDVTVVKEANVSYTEEPFIRNNNLSAPNIENQDDSALLYSGTMHDLRSCDDNNMDEVTMEKRLAQSTGLPPPAKRGQSLMSLPSQPNSIPSQSNQFSTPQPKASWGASDFWESGNIQPDSLMLNNVLGDLEMEVGGEPEKNIPINVFEDTPSSLSDDEDQQAQNEPLELRSYQKELAAPGLQGKNCIIVAPTGSGKTHVALKIIQEHMSQIRFRRHPKVVFLVEQSALAEQQALQVQKYLPCKVKLITGEVQRNERQKSFAEWLKKRDILVVTAQLLVNALLDKDVKITDFTLLVFDECHHAHANHSYNKIMHCYMDELFKLETEKTNLPMIVGLTASVGVGRTKNTDGAIEWIKTMMANLDAEELATVRINSDELHKHVIVPEQVIHKSAPRRKNYFGEAVSKIMEVTEKYMKQSAYSDTIPDKEKVLKAPPDKGSDQYTQWISKFWRETAKIFNQEARRFFTTCRSYLDLYNRALIVYEDARVKDALDFLEENIRKMNEGIIQDETDKKMMTLYEKSKALLQHCVNDPNHDNPKLETLKKLVSNTYRENMDSRGIIFVKTRDLTTAIQNWMRDTERLKVLSPIKFVGAQAGGEKGGMTRNDQENILKLFKDGRHKIIVATSVAEEGLDIQKCNLVIRYDHVTNEIAMVQARGRGRAEGSRYYVVASAQKRTAEKEELNMMREDRMNKAISHLQREIETNRTSFLEEILVIQRAANIQRELENANKGGRIVCDYEFEMRCGKCNQFICMSNDVKKIQNAHHAVIGDGIANHITTIRVPKPAFEDENIKMGVGKVNCKSCGKNLGNIVIYKKAQFPVLKIENFLVADSLGNTDVYKKWKNAPYVPQELSTDSLLERVNGRKYIPMED